MVSDILLYAFYSLVTLKFLFCSVMFHSDLPISLGSAALMYFVLFCSAVSVVIVFVTVVVVAVAAVRAVVRIRTHARAN